MKTFTIEYVRGVEGNHFAVMSEGSGMRVAGPKPWGGGHTIEAIPVNPADVFEAFGMERGEAKALAERLAGSEGEPDDLRECIREDAAYVEGVRWARNMVAMCTSTEQLDSQVKKIDALVSQRHQSLSEARKELRATPPSQPQAAEPVMVNNHAEIRRLAGLALDQPEKYSAAAVLTKIHGLATTPQPAQAEPLSPKERFEAKFRAKLEDGFEQHQRDRIEAARQHDAAEAKRLPQAAPVGELTDEAIDRLVRIHGWQVKQSEVYEFVPATWRSFARAIAALSAPVQQAAGLTVQLKTSVQVQAQFEVAEPAIYSIEAERDEDFENWYIRVRSPSGVYDYDGWWRDSADKTPDEVIAEALNGAMLSASPNGEAG